LVVILTAIGVVAGSLIFATWQHVEALRFGYRIDQLVREREKLEAMKRQLELERAYHRSPHVIEPLARRLGLIRPDASQVIVASNQQSLPRGRQASASMDLLSKPIRANESRTDLRFARTNETLHPAAGSKRTSRPKRTTPEVSAQPELDEKLVKTEETSSQSKPSVSAHVEAETKTQASSDKEKAEEGKSDAAAEQQKRRRPSKQGERP